MVVHSAPPHSPSIVRLDVIILFHTFPFADGGESIPVAVNSSESRTADARSPPDCLFVFTHVWSTLFKGPFGSLLSPATETDRVAHLAAVTRAKAARYNSTDVSTVVMNIRTSHQLLQNVILQKCTAHKSKLATFVYCKNWATVKKSLYKKAFKQEYKLSSGHWAWNRKYFLIIKTSTFYNDSQIKKQFNCKLSQWHLKKLAKQKSNLKLIKKRLQYSNVQ